MRIVIIEDSDSIRRLLEALVSARADDIVSVPTGQEGLDKAFAVTPDVVLLDLNLPGLYNGIEVCKRLRADPKTRRVPVFIVTANADMATMERASEAGATRFFPKPFSPMAILNAIDEVRRVPSTVALRPTAAPTRSAPTAPPPKSPPTGGPSASSPVRPPLPSQPSTLLPESSSRLRAAPGISRPPGSEPPKRT
jgi:CheY-like chemotaxis protein